MTRILHFGGKYLLISIKQRNLHWMNHFDWPLAKRFAVGTINQSVLRPAVVWMRDAGRPFCNPLFGHSEANAGDGPLVTSSKRHHPCPATLVGRSEVAGILPGS